MVEPVGGHGGMDYYDFGLCEGLVEAGVEITLYTCDETPRVDEVSCNVRIPYRRIYGEDPAWLRGARYLRGSVLALLVARLGRARVAHLHFFHVGPLELSNVMLAKLLGFRVVVTAHDVQSFVERLSIPWMVRVAYRLSDRIIAQGKVSKRELQTVLREPRGKIEMIAHGNYLHAVGQVPSREDARERLGLPREAGVLLFFGQVKKVKGLDVLLEAMPAVLREHPETILLVAGKAWKDDLQRYRDQIQRLGISGNCVLHFRYISDEEVPDYYAAVDAVVLPYRRIYQSGALLMAMSYEKPAVVSDLEGMTEVVSDGVNGFVFASGDARALADRLIEALSDPARLRSVGARAVSYVHEQHNWAEIGRLTAACYRAALESK